MPAYEYTCGPHTQVEFHQIGTAPRTLDCPVCGHDTMKLIIGKNVAIATSALENKGEVVRSQIAMEHGLDVDRPAYKRMRNRGMQPPHVKGSAQLEDKVGDQFDIDNGHLYPLASKSELQERQEAARMLQIGAS